MQYLDLSYRDDFVVVCGDIHGEFETLAFNVVRKGIENAIVIVAGDCGFGFNKLAYYDNLYKQKLHRKLEKQNVLLLMVRGNHDDFLDNLVPVNLGNISILQDYILESGNLRFFVTHGDVFDSVTSKMEWLAKLGDVSYTVLLRFNSIYNRIRTRQGKPYFSLSQAIKHKVKQAVSFISGFEKMLSDLARSKHCDGVICGHIHYPEDRMIDGIRYLNSGDWVESMSALLEDEHGNWRIMKYREEYM